MFLFDCDLDNGNYFKVILDILTMIVVHIYFKFSSTSYLDEEMFSTLEVKAEVHRNSVS
jgi:hypothetical protein